LWLSLRENLTLQSALKFRFRYLSHRLVQARGLPKVILLEAMKLLAQLRDGLFEQRGGA
jgi:hypothetical protein